MAYSPGLCSQQQSSRTKRVPFKGIWIGLLVMSGVINVGLGLGTAVTKGQVGTPRSVRASEEDGADGKDDSLVQTKLVEGLVIFLILFSLLVRFALHRLEKWIAKHHIHLQTVLRNLYRELMVLGLVSFLFTVYETLNHPKKQIVSSFEFAHILLFTLGVFYTVVVLFSSLTSLRLSSKWKRMEELEFVKYLQNKDEFRSLTQQRHRHEGFYWYWIGWWFPHIMSLRKYKNLHEVMAFHDLRYQFLFYRKLPIDFNFSAYLRRIKSATFIELVEAHWTLWSSLLVVVSIDMVRREVWDDKTFALAFVISVEIALSLLSMWLELKIRRVYWKLTKNPATYFDDHSTPDRGDVNEDLPASPRRSLRRSRSRSRSRSRRVSKVRRRVPTSRGRRNVDGTLADDEATDANESASANRSVSTSPTPHAVINLEQLEALDLGRGTSSELSGDRRSGESTSLDPVLRQSGEYKLLAAIPEGEAGVEEETGSRDHRILSLYTGDQTGGIRRPPKVVAVSQGAQDHAMKLDEEIKPSAQNRAADFSEQNTDAEPNEADLEPLDNIQPSAKQIAQRDTGSRSRRPSNVYARNRDISDITPAGGQDVVRPSIELAAQVPTSELHGRHERRSFENKVPGSLNVTFGEIPMNKPRDSYLERKNTAIINRVRKQREAEQTVPDKGYPAWVPKLIPRLKRVASPAEKLFWFGSHHFFLWMVELTLFISTVLISVTTASIAIKFRPDLSPDGSRISHLEIASLCVSVVNLIHVLYRTAHSLKYYTFALNNAGLVPELVAIQAIDTVKFKARLKFTEYASEGDTTESDTEAARETRRKFWRLISAESVHSDINMEGREWGDSESLARRLLRRRRRSRTRREAMNLRQEMDSTDNATNGVGNGAVVSHVTENDNETIDVSN